MHNEPQPFPRVAPSVSLSAPLSHCLASRQPIKLNQGGKQ
jgi:hypothetical protein